MIRILPCLFTVDFEEMEGSPEERVSTEWQELGAIRVFRCAAGDRFQLAREFMGYTTVFGNVVKIHKAHSYSCIGADVQAVSAEIKPIGKMIAAPDIRFANYPKGEVRITYKLPPELFRAYGGLVSVTETLQAASEFVTVPIKGLFWYVDGINNEPITVGDAPGKINNLEEWTYEVRRARAVPAGVWNAPGYVNMKPVYSRSLDRYFPSETLLCRNPTVQREITFSDITFNITLRFLIKNNGTPSDPKGWNYFPRISKPGASVSYEYMFDGKASITEKIFYTPLDFNKAGIFVP